MTQRNSFRPKLRLRFGLRFLLVFFATLSVGLWYWQKKIEPFRRQAQFAVRMRQIGADIRTQPAGEAWLIPILGEGFQQRITFANLRQVPITNEGIDELLQLDAVEQIFLRGDLLGIHDVERLTTLPSLKMLNCFVAYVPLTDLGYMGRWEQKRFAGQSVAGQHSRM